MVENAWIIPLIPFLSWFILALFGKSLPRQGDFLGTLAIGISFLLSLAVFRDVSAGVTASRSIPWMVFGDTKITMGFHVDNLAALMLLVVTFVSLMVHLFSIGYMGGDVRYKRYYAMLSFFSFSMLGLVIADNFLGLFIFWELVGLASYLLISHWYEKPDVGAAAMKAFLTTRLGDISLLLGIVLLFTQANTLKFAELGHLAESGALGGTVLTIAALLVFGGAVGKSAQFPLYVWLPDAMAGPTPVSALIHAATMVAAGVYLVARSYGIFLPSPDALTVVAWVGGITAIFAALVAVTRDDIKQVLAYSTVSQLGYMMIGLGVGGFTAGIFHLTTHAFFKALLFLGSGSVIHGTDTQDLREMGGLAKKMPITALTWIIGSAALAGIPPFAGFFSKDEILLEAFHKIPALFWIGVIAAFLTAYYITRATWLAFFGSPRDEHHGAHAHEGGWVMTLPLILLAILSIVGGFFNTEMFGFAFTDFIHFGEVEHVEPSAVVTFWAMAAAFGGVILSLLVFAVKALPTALVPYLGPAAASWVDRRVMNGAAHGLASGTLQFGEASGDFDREVIDGGAVDGLAELALGTGAALRKVQTGMVQFYALMMFLALVVGLIIFVIGG